MGETALDSTTPDPETLASELLSGLWVIALQHEEDGICYYLAVQADAIDTQRAALTQREREVLTRALLGESNKSIAISLGVGHSSVTTLLARARKRLADRVPERVLRALLARANAEPHVRIEGAPPRRSRPPPECRAAIRTSASAVECCESTHG
jgi:DNA-binding CsgD family transcriptional regulator